MQAIRKKVSDMSYSKESLRWDLGLSRVQSFPSSKIALKTSPSTLKQLTATASQPFLRILPLMISHCYGIRCSIMAPFPAPSAHLQSPQRLHELVTLGELGYLPRRRPSAASCCPTVGCSTPSAAGANSLCPHGKQKSRSPAGMRGLAF